MIKSKRISSFVVALALLFTAGLGSFAQAADTGNGARVSPVRTDLTLAPGQSKTVTVSIKNVTAAPANLQVLANDFTSKDETGAPALILTGQNAPSHGLKQYMTVPAAPVALQPGEQKSVNVLIKLPANAPAGGYFGAVRFLPVSASGANNVNLSASVASLILLRVSGTVNEKVTVAGFDVRQGDHPRLLFNSGKDLKAVVRLQNQGDVQEEPFGKVQLKKGNTTLGLYEINNTEPKGNVLPDSIRRFSVNLDKVGNFGKYTVEGNFGYGDSGQVVTAKTTFYVVPLPLIITAIAVLLLILFLIFGLPRLIRRYNRRVLRRANRRY